MIGALLIFIFAATSTFFLPLRVEGRGEPQPGYSSEDSTVAYYKKAIKINPTNVEAYRNLGMHYARMGLWEVAIDYFKQGLNIAPKDTGLLYQLGISYYSKGDYPEAEEIFRKIIYYSPTGDAYFNLGAVLAREKKYEETVEIFKKALESKEGDTEVLFHLAGVYLVMGEYESAINTYTKIIGLLPKDPRAYEGRASAYWKLGNREMSVSDLKTAKKLRTGVGLREAEKFSREKKQEKSQQKEKRGESPEIYTDDPDILYCVGEIHQITGEYELAVKTYTLAIRIESNNPKYYRERARVYKLLGRIKEAEADLEKVKELEK